MGFLYASAQVGVGTAGGLSASQSTTRAIWPSGSTAPPDSGGAPADFGGQRAGDQLVLADEPRDRRARRGRRAADDHAGPASGVGRAPSRAPPSRSGGRRRSSTSIGAPATVRTAWSANRTVRSTRSIGTANGAARPRRAAPHDRQRQRQPDLRGRSAPELRGEQHLAAELAHGRAHRVHPDPAAGDVAGRLGGGEAGREEQLGGVFASTVSTASAAISRAPRPRATSGGVDPAAVVAHRMITWPPAWRAEISSVPVGGLPRGDALAGAPARGRARCGRGGRAGRRARRRVRSSSVSLPASWSSTRLSSLVAGRARAAGSAGTPTRPGPSAPA